MKKRNIIGIIIFGLLAFTVLSYAFSGDEQVDLMEADVGELLGYKIMYVNTGPVNSTGDFYLLSEQQYDYAINEGIFDKPTTDKEHPINNKEFTIHKSGEKTRLANYECYYLDNIKVK
jgi:hypothetical protein